MLCFSIAFYPYHLYSTVPAVLQLIVTRILVVMPKPGLLYVTARFTNPDLSDEAFNKWYDGEHIPHLLTLRGVRAIARFVKTDSGADTPYLSLCSVHDTAWLHSGEMAAMQDSTDSDLLPEGNALRCVDFGARFYEHIQTYELPGAKSGTYAFDFFPFIRRLSSQHSLPYMNFKK